MVASRIMLVFMLTAVPLSYVAILLMLEGQSLPGRVTLGPFIKGAVSWVIVYLVMLVFDGLLPLYYDAPQIFLHYAGIEFLFPVVILTACYYLLDFSVWKDSRIEGLISMIGFFAGFYFVRSISDFFTQHNYYGPYYLFMLPLARVAMMAIIPSALVGLRSEHSWLRWIYLLVAVVSAPAFAVVPLLHTIRYETAAIVYCAVLFVAGIGASFAIVRLYVPVRV